MSLLKRTCAALALTLSLPLAAAPAPMHSQFLPPDDLTCVPPRPISSNCCKSPNMQWWSAISVNRLSSRSR